jgi:phosphohistidine phosphatase SixA
MTAERAGLDLVLVRHADAGDPAAWTGPDATRPLSSKGRKQASRVARFLREIRLEPDAIITSPKIRAAETAAAIGEAVGVDVRVDDRLAEGFGLPELDGIVREGSFRRPILVGHDPDFSELVELLIGASIPLRKGALARIEVIGDVIAGAGAGTLRWLIPPDALRPER